ncbi:MAG: hypothetical protein ACE5D7_00825 [Fidelibacterota bacterium]
MITYTNIFYDTVLKGIRNLMRAEFDEPISFDGFEDESGSFYISPVSDDFLDDAAIAHVRRYTVQISYHGKVTFEHATKRAERLKRLLFNNLGYSVSGAYQWHDGEIDSVEYSEDEENPEIVQFNLNYSVTVHEAIS